MQTAFYNQRSTITVSFHHEANKVVIINLDNVFLRKSQAKTILQKLSESNWKPSFGSTNWFKELTITRKEIRLYKN